MLTPGPNSKDNNKNAQHKKDLSECLHRRTDMWFTNVKVLCGEYKMYFSSTQNLLLLL